MLNVKLLVLSALIVLPIITFADYCEICLNHVLCQYPISGPSKRCIEYDESALLTRDDISDIVHWINDRRNFIALGLSRRLPQAANMRKISWSEELATFAQRWVDQCEPAINPDKLDDCRDFVDMAVGQNIATILGPAPGLTVKSFIDTWLMQKMDYTGSVSYYNESRNAKTNFFTQLIWAETDSVGCGKAKFYIEDKNIIAERFVCNFGPRGNIQGKPVYAIGFPATQCPNNFGRDKIMRGLCSPQKRKIEKIYSRSSTVTSLLRLINLFNESAKQDIDPTSLKLFKFEENRTRDQRNQKTRHVVMNNVNNSHASLPLFPEGRIPWNIPMTTGRYLPLQHQTEKGFPKVYHGFEKDKFIPQITETSIQDLRRYDFTTEAYLAPASTDLRRHGIPDPSHSCSRQPNCNSCGNSCGSNCHSPGCNSGCVSDRCTRGQRNDCCHGNQPCAHEGARHMCRHDSCRFSPLPCPPVCPPACPPAPFPCCETTCCNSHTTCCPKIGRRDQGDGIKDKSRKSGELHYYDLLPSLAVRSGDTEMERSLFSSKKLWTSTPPRTISTFETIKRKLHHESDDVKTKWEQQKSYGADYLYGSLGYSDRIRREPEDHVTFKPFWQLDGYSNMRPSQLKSLHYTTLKKNKKNWPAIFTTQTESITIKFKNSDTEKENEDIVEEEEDDEDGERDVEKITEKYLSFDELMHLRKINGGNYNARRATTGSAKRGRKNKNTPSKQPRSKTKTKSKSKSNSKSKSRSTYTTKNKRPTGTTEATKTATKAATTTKKDILKRPEASENTVKKNAVEERVTAPMNYTTNTPFQRKKHCTRQLTCTWTIATVTASDGSVVVGGGGAVGGSRTPPGYVEGCTRTSTCTRDFQNRNKYIISNVADDAGKGTGGNGNGDDGGEDDGDYCERRSLDVQVRKIDTQNHENYESHTLSVTSPPLNKPVTSPICKTDNLEKGSPDQCECHNGEVRPKRHLGGHINTDSYGCNNDCSIENTNHQDQLLSYGELYYLVLSKIMKTWSGRQYALHSENCQCNSSKTIKNFNVGLTLTIILCIFIL